MERLIFPIHSFIAYVEYLPENCQLDVILRQGKKYAYNVPQSIFEDIKQANNKGSYVAVNVITKAEAHYIEVVPKATIELITLPKTKYYRKFLAL